MKIGDMEIGDIKIEALKLMFVNGSFDFGIDDLPTMVGNENYGSYLVNMNGSISRALDRIQNACVVPLKTRIIGENELVKGKYYDRFDMAKIDDLYVIDKVVAESGKYGYNGHVEYQIEGNNLILKSGFDYTVIYYPTIKTIDDSIGDATEIWIPEHIARLIPLFIKGELYQEEEPSAAQDAMNRFETTLEDLKKNRQGNQTRIKRVYGY